MEFTFRLERPPAHFPELRSLARRRIACNPRTKETASFVQSLRVLISRDDDVVWSERDNEFVVIAPK